MQCILLFNILEKGWTCELHFLLLASRSNRSNNRRDLSNNFFGGSLFGGGGHRDLGFPSDFGFGNSFGDR
jgi:hypothetical protein